MSCFWSGSTGVLLIVPSSDLVTQLLRVQAFRLFWCTDDVDYSRTSDIHSPADRPHTALSTARLTGTSPFSSQSVSPVLCHLIQATRTLNDNPNVMEQIENYEVSVFDDTGIQTHHATVDGNTFTAADLEFNSTATFQSNSHLCIRFTFTLHGSTVSLTCCAQSVPSTQLERETIQIRWNSPCSWLLSPTQWSRSSI